MWLHSIFRVKNMAQLEIRPKFRAKRSQQIHVGWNLHSTLTALGF